MAEILYTTTALIRATIGCDEQDLPDEVINNRSLDLLMLERLEEVYPTHESYVSETVDRRLALWCQYFGALTLIEDAVLSLAQKIQANTDQLQRFDVDFEQLKKDLKAKIMALEGRLNSALAPTSFTVMGKATPGYNPITGV